MPVKTAATAATVKRYMRSLVLVGECLDCGEVNCTLLGEDAVLHFNLDDSPEADVWDWASEVADWYDRTQP